MDTQRRLILGLAAGSAFISSASLASSDDEHKNSLVFVTQEDDIQKILDKGKKILILNPNIVYKWNNISIPSGTTILGNGARVMTTSLKHPIIKISEHKTDILIENVRFDGDISKPIGQKVFKKHIGIEIYKSKNVSICGCDFKHFLGAGLSVYNYTGKKMSSAIQISNCRFTTCQYGFMAWYYCEYGVLDSCHFTDCRAAIYICSGNWLVTGNQVVKCRAAYISTNLPNEIAFRTGGNFSHGNLTGNTFNHSNDSPWPATPLKAGDNTSQITGIYFENVLPVTFTGNALWYTDFCGINLTDDFFVTGTTFSNGNIEAKGEFEIILTGCWIRNSVDLVGNVIVNR